eukprot:TRINITY_DN17387_c0_g1_i1.p1 TRINITY_DN17387_c0_g1~~TRINITY_DN17387_c0_g1_i1.p1  ORF type:complete len:261 (-),score=43.55 TRINITY_DN17387_c0_g1_i1:45-827(-)
MAKSTTADLSIYDKFNLPQDKVLPRGLAESDDRFVRIVLVLCGSFSPLTLMHMRTFEMARDFVHKRRLGVVVGGLISPVSDAYKKKGLAPAHHRRKMCEIGCESSDWVAVQPWESLQDEYVPTVQVLQHIKADLLDKARQEPEFEEVVGGRLKVMLLCGADLVRSFTIPGVWEDDDVKEILNDFGCVCVERNRCENNLPKLIFDHDVLYENQQSIHVINNLVTNDLSSSFIRTCLGRGESVRYLVQDGVVDYIQQEDLYS